MLSDTCPDTIVGSLPHFSVTWKAAKPQEFRLQIACGVNFSVTLIFFFFCLITPFALNSNDFIYIFTSSHFLNKNLKRKKRI